MLALTARFLWLSDLAAHFPVQYAALALVLFVLFLTLRSPGWAALALAIAVFNAMNAAPGLMTHPVAVPKPSADSAVPAPARFRVISINVLYSNHKYGGVADAIRAAQPDAVVLVEMNARWRKSLTGLEHDFPYRYQTVGPDRRGIDMWSRQPLKDVSVLPIGTGEPSIQATLMAEGRPLRLFAIHLSWPMTPSAAAQRNKELVLLAEQASATTLPLVAVGDLNLSPFSPYFRQLLADGKLRSAAEGFGWQPTWPSFLPPAGIQIDHALVSAGVGIRDFRRGLHDGSDHRPIIVDVTL
ncbi:MAG: endonuclease/exonuclease/phosphatase family protein [Gammaproteobacteria bacterium]